MKKKISLDIGFGHSHSAIESGYEPYKIGQWIRNDDNLMLVKELESKLDYRKILLRNNSLLDNVITNTTICLNKFNRVNKKEKYWEQLSGHILPRTFNFAIILWYRIKEYEENFDCYYKISDPKWVPGKEYSLDSIGLSESLLGQLASIIIRETKSPKFFKVIDNNKIENPNFSIPTIKNISSTQISKWNHLKRPFKTLLLLINKIMFRMIDYLGYKILRTDRVIVTHLPSNLLLRVLLSLHTGYLLVRNLDLIDKKFSDQYNDQFFIKWNHHRERFTKIVNNYAIKIEGEIERLVTYMIPIIMPITCLEKWENHDKEKYQILIKPFLACFNFCNNLERAKYHEMGGKVIYYQDSLTIDTYLDVVVTNYYKKLSDHYITWGKKMSQTDIPLKANKIKEFLRSYKINKNQINSNVDIELPLLWMPIGPAVGYDFTDFINNPNETIEFYHRVLNILEKNSNNFLVRRKPVPPQLFYSKLFDDGINKRVSKYLTSNKIPSGKSVAQSSLVIGDLLSTTVLAQCISINHPILLILNKRPWWLNNQTNEVFLRLEQGGVVRMIEDCNDNDLSKIFENPSDWWNKEEVKEAVNYYRNIFLPELPNEYQQWLNAINTIKKYHAKA